MGNHVAIGMYERFGYSVYRRVIGYYHSATGNLHSDEDAYGTHSLSFERCEANGRYEETSEAG